MRQRLRSLGLVWITATVLLFAFPVKSFAQNAPVKEEAPSATSLERPNHRRFNVRILGGGTVALGNELKKHDLGRAGAVGALGIDWVLTEPLAFSILAGYGAFIEGDAGAMQDLFVTVGFRLRLLTDKSGAATQKGGNLAGHLFMDAHFGYHSYDKEEHAGYNIGLGYELSIAKDFNLGPFVRFTHTPIGDGFPYQAISFGIQASVGGKFEPDDVDHDGIEDDDDQCPLKPEDKDGFEDKDGCAEPDNDHDGVLDVDDKCPETAGVPTNHGCEENDNDHDGVLNIVDECPEEAEDKDKFKDKDGCPDPDNDGDGILDADDRCPNKKEDKDGYEDEDGCPDRDNDGDKIVDKRDKCPFIPETINNFEDKDGCPDFVSLTGNRIVLKQPILFDKKNHILEESAQIVDELAALLMLRTDLFIRIEGHTDNRGGKKKNQKNASIRAENIKTHLVQKGIAESRLETAGLGQASPIADNKKPAEREKNNRIEIHLTEGTMQPPTETPPPSQPTQKGAAPQPQ